MIFENVTKKEIREMSWNDALELLMDGAKSHLKGAGCGPGHQIPVGKEKHNLIVAMAKAHYKRWKVYPDYVESTTTTKI